MGWKTLVLGISSYLEINAENPMLMLGVSEIYATHLFFEIINFFIFILC
jgi:hypothetical protein